MIDRARDTPEFFLDYLKELDNKPNYENYKLNSNELKILKENIDLLPKSYLKELKKTLVGIYFIKDFWGSGLCQFVLDSKNKVYTIVVLNPKLLNMSLNDAFLMKELSCFKNDVDNIRLEVNISENHNGILYTLLHEFTHSIDYTKRLTPYTHSEMLKYVNENKKSKLVQKNIWENYNTINFNYRSEVFDMVSFYGFNNGPHIKISDAKNLYMELSKTPFVTLYSTSSWAEDIADLFTIQYLVEKLDCNFEIKLYVNDKLIYLYDLKNREFVDIRFSKNDFF